MPVRTYTAQSAHLTPVPNTDHLQDLVDPAVDDVQNPSQITVYAPGPIAALRIAERHLTLLHARHAYANPSAVTRTAMDVVYAEARACAETLGRDQRCDESLHAIHSEEDALRRHALTDIMRERGELPD
ncbi:hypothetical protein ACWECC_17185 [Streptomyces microflavus]